MNIIDPHLITLVREALDTLSFLANPMTDARHLRQLTDQEGLIWALQLTLMAATRKGYLFPRKGAMEHLRLLLENAQQLKQGRSYLSRAEQEQSEVPLLTFEEETVDGERALVPYAFVPRNFINQRLFETNRGVLAAEEGIKVNMSTLLAVAGGNMVADKEDIDLYSGDDMSLAAAADRHQQGQNYHETKAGGAFYAPNGKLMATAEGDLDRQAIHVEAKTGAKFKAGGSGVDAALPLHSHSVMAQEGGETVTHQVNQAVSTYRIADGKLEEEFEGTLDTYAQDVKAKAAETTAAQVREHAVHDTYHQTTNIREDRGPFGGSHEVKEERFEAKAKGARFELEEPREITATKGGISLEAVNYQVPRVILNAPNGAIQFLAGRNVYQSFRTEKEASVVWQSMTQDARVDVTHSACEFSEGCVIETHARETVLVEKVQGQALEWLQRLELNGAELTYRELEELHLLEHFEVEGPTAALGAVVALAVTIATSGAGAAVGAAVAGISNAATATVMQTLVMATTQAAFNSVCSRAAVSLLQNNGDILKAAQDLVSKDGLKSLLTAMGTAGLDKGLGSIPSRVAMGLINKKKLSEIVTGIVVDRIGRSLAHDIGEAKLDGFTHKLAHAAVGAGIGAALSKNHELGALSGAVGAAVAETLADVMKDKSQELMEKALEKADELGIEPSRENLAGIMRDDLQTIIDVSHLGGAVAALLMGLDPDVAAYAAANALYNNFALSSVTEALEGYAEAVAETATEIGIALGEMTVEKLEQIADILENNPQEVAGCAEIILLTMAAIQEDRAGRALVVAKAGAARKAEQLKKDGIIASLKAAPKVFRDWARKISAGKSKADAAARPAAVPAGAPRQMMVDEGVAPQSDLSVREKLFGTDNVAQFKGDRVKPIGGRKPINAEYAGKVYTFDKLPVSIKEKYPNLQRDYQHGIPFTGNGHPDFSRYAVKKVEVGVTGIRWKDEALANKAAGFSKRPDGYTWHHHEDGKTMMLVPFDLHDAVKHSGGVAVLKGEILK